MTHAAAMLGFQWPSGLRRRSKAVRLLGLRVRIPQRAWMFVFCLGSKDKKKSKMQKNHDKDISTDEVRSTRECREKKNVGSGTVLKAGRARGANTSITRGREDAICMQDKQDKKRDTLK